MGDSAGQSVLLRIRARPYPRASACIRHAFCENPRITVSAARLVAHPDELYVAARDRPFSSRATRISPSESSPTSVDSRSLELERLLRKFGALVRRAALARGLQEADIDEVLQDVRVRLWKSGASSEKLEGLGSSYMQRVAMSAAIDLLRRRRRERREESIDELNEMSDPPAALRTASVDRSDDDELARRFEAALSKLPRNRRVVVQLHLEGYGRDEIAALVGWTEPKVRNLLYRGLDDLRVQMRQSSPPGS